MTDRSFENASECTDDNSLDSLSQKDELRELARVEEAETRINELPHEDLPSVSDSDHGELLDVYNVSRGNLSCSDGSLEEKQSENSDKNTEFTADNNVNSESNILVAVQNEESGDGIPDSGVKSRNYARALWQDIPTPQDIPFYKADSSSSAIDKHDIIMVAASRRGRAHAHVGSPRDDDYGMTYDALSGWYIMIVADGAGSATYSRKGAEILCRYVIDNLPKMLDKEECFVSAVNNFTQNDDAQLLSSLISLKKAAYKVLPKVVFDALKSIKDIADNTSGSKELRDFATTALLAVVKKVNDRWLVISFSIGDGAIVVYDKNESLGNKLIVRDGKTVYCYNSLLMNNPDTGPYSGQTRFITTPNIFQSADLINRITVHTMSDFTSIMLMSDGVSDAKFNSEAELENKMAWDNFWSELTEDGGDDTKPVDFNGNTEDIQKDLLEWLNFWSIGNHDDRTIIVMNKHEQRA